MKATKDDLGMRMKQYYEEISKTRLMRRTPVAVRIDGRAFHTFTKHMNKPFDRVLMQSMQKTMLKLCENIQGCVYGYTQSDEITLILKDYENLNTSSFFDYEVQKMCSIIASMATLYFNKEFIVALNANSDFISNKDVYFKAIEKGAMFDARVFNIPKEEVANLLYWRQLDAMRNSVQMVAHAYFNHKKLDGVSSESLKYMIRENKDITNWEDYDLDCQRGASCYKKKVKINTSDGGQIERGKWVIDKKIPIFKDEGKEHIEKLIV